MKTAALHNLGCKVNAYETEAMQQLLEASGYRIVDFSQKADIYIINTCSVTNVADKKSRQMLHRAKKQNPDSIVVAAGCYAQSAEETLKKDASVDIIIGNNKKKELPQILEEYFAARQQKKEDPRPRVHVIDISKARDYEELHIEKIAGHTRAFFKGSGRLQSILHLLYYSLHQRADPQPPSGGGCGGGGRPDQKGL